MVAPVEPFAPAEVTGAWDETANLRAITLDLGVARAARYTVPGQCIKVQAGGAEGFFAIASPPDGKTTVELLLKRGGAAADAAIAAAKVGHALLVAPPLGRGFPVEAAHGKDVMLFAAGSGITPIRALVRHMVEHRERFGRVALFYGQRSHEDFAYTREHAAWDEGGVKVVLCTSQPSAAWNGQRGYVQEVAHALGFLDLSPAAAVAYLSGMKSMVAGVRDVLARAGVPQDRVLLNF